MKLNCNYKRYVINDKGNIEVTFEVTPESRWIIPQAVDWMMKLRAENKLITIDIDEYKSTRSQEQNKLMWKLLSIMALHFNGGRTGGVTDWDCYINMLEKFGAKFEYIMCLPEAVAFAKEQFRAIKEIETREYNGKFMTVLKCFYGSSKNDTKQQSLLIDGIFDTLTEMGVNDTDIKYLHDDWSKAK